MLSTHKTEFFSFEGLFFPVWRWIFRNHWLWHLDRELPAFGHRSGVDYNLEFNDIFNIVFLCLFSDLRLAAFLKAHEGEERALIVRPTALAPGLCVSLSRDFLSASIGRIILSLGTSRASWLVGRHSPTWVS